MDASNWIAIAAILVSPVVYFWGKRDERRNQKVGHDKAVFARLDTALPYNDLKGFLDTLDEGYFLRETGTEIASFQNLIKEPANAFLLPELQEKILTFSSVLLTLRAYTGEHFSTKNADTEMVHLHPEKKRDVRRELLPLIEQAEQRYKEFRASIKENLAI